MKTPRLPPPPSNPNYTYLSLADFSLTFIDGGLEADSHTFVGNLNDRALADGTTTLYFPFGPVSIPEPSTYALLASMVAIAGLVKRRNLSK